MDANEYDTADKLNCSKKAGTLDDAKVRYSGNLDKVNERWDKTVREYNKQIKECDSYYADPERLKLHLQEIFENAERMKSEQDARNKERIGRIKAHRDAEAGVENNDEAGENLLRDELADKLKARREAVSGGGKDDRPTLATPAEKYHKDDVVCNGYISQSIFNQKQYDSDRADVHKDWEKNQQRYNSDIKKCNEYYSVTNSGERQDEYKRQLELSATNKAGATQFAAGKEDIGDSLAKMVAVRKDRVLVLRNNIEAMQKAGEPVDEGHYGEAIKFMEEEDWVNAEQSFKDAFHVAPLIATKADKMAQMKAAMTIGSRFHEATATGVDGDEDEDADEWEETDEEGAGTEEEDEGEGGEIFVNGRNPKTYDDE